tara:strand:+ start:2791 stop:3645 length:855 start_codon:yes stop_codon:yes gene_type:complete
MGIHDIQDYNHESLDNLNSLLRTNNTKLDNVISNTANIKASLEVGGNLIINVDDLETLQTTANTHLATIASGSGSSGTLPTGASTEAKQDTVITALNTLNANSILNGNGRVILANRDDTGATTTLRCDPAGSLNVNTGALAISSQPLPALASTEAKQDTMITSLSAIQASVAETEGDTENVKSKLDNLNIKANNRDTHLADVKTKLDNLNTAQGNTNTKLDGVETQAVNTNTKLDNILTSNTSQLTKQTDIKQVLDNILTTLTTINTTLGNINTNSNTAGYFGN